MTKVLVSVLLLLSVVDLQAQFSYTLHQDVPVKNLDGNAFDMAWAGGLNSTQYNTMDLNGDGTEDLVLYDRMAAKISTYLSLNDNYKYSPEYEIFFPVITNWILLRDYNCDGKKDLFTGDPLGIKVFLNTQTSGIPSWKQLQFFTGFPGSKSNVLLTKGFSGKINIQLQYDDLPSISDADGDGDLDIFNMRFAGGTIEFHKNYSIEKYGTCDSLDYERVTQAWGNVRDCHCGTFAFNGEDCSSSGRVKHSGGKSLLLLDVDNDKRLDLIFSEAECSFVFELHNEGDLLSPVINKSFSFPVSQPVEIVSYPAAYYEDVDFDQKKDLIFSSNLYFKDELESNFAESNILYKNSGTTSAPVFTRVKDNFLQERMIDIGDNSIPAFTDFDGDGDYDMFVSSNSSHDLKARIFLFENKGTEKSPDFKLTNDDYLFFSESSFYNLKIQFADVNADNKVDLVFSASSLEQSGTRLYFVNNKNQLSLDFNNQPVIQTDFTLNFYENVYMTDIDLDGKIDLLAGRGNGKVEYWKNVGIDSQLELVLEDSDYLKLGSSGFNQNISTFIADLDGDGNSDLVYSNENGQLAVINDFKNASDASTAIREIIFNKLTDKHTTHNLGGKIWPVAVNLFNTTKPSIIAGNTLGGLFFLKSDSDEALPDVPTIELFPNPADLTKIVNIKIDRPAVIEVISALGQRLNDPVHLQAHQTYQYKLSGISPGVYFLKFTYQQRSLIKRIVLY